MSCAGHLENTDSLNNADFSNVETFHYMLSKKTTFIKTISDVIRRVFKYWEAVKLTVVDKSFPKFWCLLESLSLTLATSISNCFP